MSHDGARIWKRPTASTPWARRAGGAAVVIDGAIYLLGGEAGFACQPVETCVPPYFNDVWRTRDGKNWRQVSDSPWNITEVRYDFALISRRGS